MVGNCSKHWLAQRLRLRKGKVEICHDIGKVGILLSSFAFAKLHDQVGQTYPALSFSIFILQNCCRIVLTSSITNALIQCYICRTIPLKSWSILMSADAQIFQAMKIANQQGEYNAKEAVASPCLLLLRKTANKADLRFYPGWTCTTLWILWINLISHSCSSRSQKNPVIVGDREIIRRVLVSDYCPPESEL